MMKYFTEYCWITAVILTYSLASAQVSCGDALYKCSTTYTENKDATCSKTRSYLDCLRAVINNPTLCSAELKSQVQEAFDIAYKSLPSQGCSDSPTSNDNSCAFAVLNCATTVTDGDSKNVICSKARSSLDCLSAAVNNPNLCSAELKAQNQAAFDIAYKELQSQGCSGAGTLMTSLLLCMGVSGVAYFLTALK